MKVKRIFINKELGKTHIYNRDDIRKLNAFLIKNDPEIDTLNAFYFDNIELITPCAADEFLNMVLYHIDTKIIIQKFNSAVEQVLKAQIRNRGFNMILIDTGEFINFDVMP